MENKKTKNIPEFKNEDEERNFWAIADSTGYVDWSSVKHGPTKADSCPAIAGAGRGQSEVRSGKP